MYDFLAICTLIELESILQDIYESTKDIKLGIGKHLMEWPERDNLWKQFKIGLFQLKISISSIWNCISIDSTVYDEIVINNYRYFTLYSEISMMH